LADDLEAELSAFVAARYVHLRRTAHLLCGDWHRAEDLVQTALARVVVAARRRRVESLDAYTRQALLRVFLNDTRVPWRRKERSMPDPAELSAEQQEDRTTALTVLNALRLLPPRQRAVVVLRFWEDRSVEETAELLQVATGTVKSQTAKALQALRAALADVQIELIQRGG
jgi:RNA polymerase sigma-70 factor (sigma-E family)